MQSMQSLASVYIDSDESLRSYCQQWSQATVLFLDTEFIRTDTFYPIGALIQLSDGRDCFLIDPLAINDLAPFADILRNSNIIKVLHSSSEDLEVFDRLFGVLPQPLFDTQIAAGLDGLGFSLGYQGLTEMMLQQHVEKGETRSNWLQRPLTSSQIHYAALDVAHLPALYQLLVESLESKGRLSWLQEECQLMVERYLAADQGESYYQKIKSAWKLSPPQLALLQRLCFWREQQARQLNVPRGRVIKDSCCFDIARLQPREIRGLSAIDELGSKAVRNYGELLLTMVSDTRELAAGECPAVLARPLPTGLTRLLKLLKAHIAQRAEQLQMASQLLVKKKDYEELLRSGYNGAPYQLPASLSGWRKSVVGSELLQILEREVSK